MKKISFGHPGEGVSITYEGNHLILNGWYDNSFGISGGSTPLKEFLETLGISKEDVMKCYEKGGVE